MVSWYSGYLYTYIYGISRDGSRNFNIRTCEHMILGQLRMGARQAKNAPLLVDMINLTLVCEDANSKLVKVFTVANVARFKSWSLVNILPLMFCRGYEVGARFSQYFEF